MGGRDGHFIARRNPVLAVAAVLGGLAFVVGCTVEAPDAPEFDVGFTIPLIDTTYTMANLIDQNSDFLSASGDTAFFEVETPPGRGVIGDALTVSPAPQTYQTDVGLFALGAPGVRFSEDFRLDALAPDLAALDGQEVPLPAFAFDATSPLSPYENFVTAVLSDRTVKDGVTINTVTVTLINDLPVPLEGIELVLVGAEVGAAEIARFTFAEPVLPGARAEEIQSIASARISTTMNVGVAGGSPGSGNDFVLIDAGASFRVGADISPLEVVQAEAKVPGFRRPEDGFQQEVISYPNRIAVTEAVIKSGTLFMDFSGTVKGLPETQVLVQLADFVDADGATLPVQSLVLDEEGFGNTSIDISGFTFKPELSPDPVGEGEQDIRFAWAFDTPGSGAVPITLQSQNSFEVALRSSDLVFTRIQGFVNQLSVNIPPWNRWLTYLMAWRTSPSMTLCSRWQ